MESYNSLAKYFAKQAEDYTKMAQEWANDHNYHMALVCTAKAEVYKQQSNEFESKAYYWEESKCSTQD